MPPLGRTGAAAAAPLAACRPHVAQPTTHSPLHRITRPTPRHATLSPAPLPPHPAVPLITPIPLRPPATSPSCPCSLHPTPDPTHTPPQVFISSLSSVTVSLAYIADLLCRANRAATFGLIMAIFR